MDFPRLKALFERSQGSAIFEMANLDKPFTGMEKIIYISTAEEKHSPRVKLYYKTGKDQPSTSISISDDPQKIKGADSLNPSNDILKQAFEFVRLNKDALLRFWFHGHEMTATEVDDMKQNFIRVNQKKQSEE